jgi:sulfur-oxidizing protein SoxY
VTRTVAPPLLARRALLGLAGGAAGLLAAGLAGRAASRGAAAAAHDPTLEVRLPVLTENGAKVPIVVAAAHPMLPDHHIRRLEVANPGDPVPGKGVFEFTPANGQAYVAYQARLDEGVSEVRVAADCNRHGRYRGAATVRVAPGGGGCAAPAPAPHVESDEIRPPAIRIPRLVKGLGVRPGEIVEVQVTVRHPSRTGLGLRAGVFVQESEPFFIRELVAWYGAQPVSRFLLTPALSDNPLITFRLRLTRAEPVRVVLTNSRGERFEATHPIRLA